MNLHSYPPFLPLEPGEGLMDGGRGRRRGSRGGGGDEGGDGDEEKK